MTDEQKYLFDLNGYLVLEQVVPPDVITACNEVLDRYEKMDEAEFPLPLKLGDKQTDQNLYISNILEGDPAFRPLIDLPGVVDVVQTVSGSTYRLNHTYTICRWGGGYTGLHMHGTPIIDKCQYRCENGQIVSTLTKAVFPTLDCGPEDGCFAVIPGSHKSTSQGPGDSIPKRIPLSHLYRPGLATASYSPRL